MQFFIVILIFLNISQLIKICRQKRSPLRRTLKLTEKLLQSQTLPAHSLQHIIPQPIRGHRMALLAQVNAIDRHDLHISRRLVAAQKYAGLLEERLIDDGKVVGVEFGHVADALHDLDKGALEATKQVALGGVVGSKEAGTLDGSGQLARPGYLDTVHGVGEVDERRRDEVDEGSSREMDVNRNRM